MGDKIDVSIIIVNYHTSSLLVECLKSINENTTALDYEVIIVDNGSEPDLKEILESTIKEINKKNYRLILLNDNKGFGSANNEGLKIARGRNILFLNPDILLLNNGIKTLSDFLDNNPKVGACGGNLHNANMQPVYSFKRISPGILWETDELLNNWIQKLLYGKNKNYNHKEKPDKVKNLSGANLMVKKKCLNTTGNFSDKYFMYFEDTDLCRRIRKAGWSTYNIPQAKFIHFGSKASKNLPSEVKLGWLEESRRMYYQQHLSPFEAKISDFIYYIFLLSRILLIKDFKKREIYKKRMKYFKNG